MSVSVCGEGSKRMDQAVLAGAKLMLRKCHLNTRKNSFTAQATEPWNRLPEEAVEPPSL